MSNLRVDTEFTGEEGVILRVTGDLDLATHARLEAPLQTLQMDGRPNIVLDLSEVGFIDSTGLRVLSGAELRARLRGGSVLIRGASDQALDLFKLTGLDEALIIEPRFGTAS